MSSTTAANPPPTPPPTLYEQSRLPPSLDTGTIYPTTDTPYPTATSLSALLALYNGPEDDSIIENMPTWDPVLEAATSYLEELLHPTTGGYTSKALKALKRLQPWFMGSGKPPAWGPDIIFKAFNDLDLAFFDGQLRGRCQLQWKNEEELQALFPKAIQVWGTTLPIARRVEDPLTWNRRRVLSAHIYLNSTKHFLDPITTYVDEKGVERERTRWQEMWGTLLHEMCHAYLRLVTWEGYRDFMWSEGSDRGHGSHFKRCLKAVNARSEYILGIVGIFEEGEKTRCCGGKGDSGVEENNHDEVFNEQEWDEEEYEEEYDEEEYDEEEYDEEEYDEETEDEATSIGDQSIFDEDLIDLESTNGDISDAEAPEAKHEAKAEPKQESTKSEQVEAKIETVKAAAKPQATPAAATWTNWGGKLMENVELRHVSGGKLMENVELRHVSKDVSMEKKVEVEKRLEVEEKKVNVEEKKAEVVTWANWKGKLLENKRR